MNNNEKYRKLLIGFLPALILIVLGFWIFSYLNSAEITVSSNSATNYVSIIPIINGEQVNNKAQHRIHIISLRVKPGSYAISAFNKVSSVSRVINIKAHQNLSFNLDVVTASAPEPVYGNSITGLNATTNQLVFLDSDNLLTGIDANNNVTKIFPDTRLYDLKWSSQTLGIARDENKNIYLINNLNVTKLNLPFAVSSNLGVSYGVSNGGNVYVSQGTAIYKGSLGGNFQKIYSSNEAIESMSVSNGFVAVVVSKNASSPDPTNSILLINDGGKIVRNSYDANQVLWSPDGKYMLASGQSGFIILNSSLNQIASIPSITANNFSWGADDNLFYSQVATLWTYIVNQSQSIKLADMPAKAAIVGVFSDDSNQYIYVAATGTNTLNNNSSSASQLLRVGLKGQSFSGTLTSLSAFLPETLGYCAINYINFTHPTIQSEFPFTGSQQNCQSLAQGELQTYGLDINSFNYNFIRQGAD